LTAIRISCRVNPTESPEKVRKALSNMFGEIEMVEADSEFTAELDDYLELRELRARIAQDKIRDTLSDILTRWTEDNRLSFGLNRQAAYNGHVSLTLENEDPMGPINVMIDGDVRQAITFLTS
jgi:predicted RNA binding protein with dsRBD fold (UPF0201 family)